MLKQIDPLEVTNEQLLEVYSFIRDMGQKILDWGEVCYDMFDASIVSEGSLNQGQINGYLDDALGYQSK